MLIPLHPGPFWFDHMAVKGDEASEVSVQTGEYTIPSRECDLCRQSERVIELARYDLDIPEATLRNVFKRELPYALSFKDFETFAEQLTRNANIKKGLLPGTRIGNPIFRLLTKQRDFVQRGVIIFVSERAVDCVCERSIKVTPVPINVIGRAKHMPKYFYLVPVISNLMDEEWIKLERTQCPRCKQWSMKSGIYLPKIIRPSKAQIVKSRWPENEGVVYSPDIGGTYYSPEFVQACRDAKLDGMGFTQVWWV